MSSTISLFWPSVRTQTPGLLYLAAMAQRHRLRETLTVQLTIHELVTIHDALRILREEWRLAQVPALDEQVEIIVQHMAAVLSQNGVG